MKSTADTAAQPGRFDPSTWAGQARQLARNEAQAMTLITAMAAVAAMILALLAARHLLGLSWSRLLSPDLLVVVALNGLLLLAVYGWTYARTLRRDTQAVRCATWQKELATGRDLDGDGFVGPPKPVGHVMRINTPEPAEVVLPDLNPPRGERPLVEFPAAPPITANDVVYILHRAAAGDGLGFRAWDKHRLPSGATVNRDLWVGILDGLVAWQFATTWQDGAGRRRVELRSGIGVEAMIHAVRVGVGELDQ